MKTLDQKNSTIHRTTSGALALVLALAGAGTALAQNNYTSGHGDIGIAYEEDGTFFLHGHLGSNAVVDGMTLGGPDGEEFEPEDFTTVVPESEEIVVPPGLGTTFYSGTGTSAGDSLWILPQSEKPGVPFLGFATEELVSGEWGNITFTLGSVFSPSGTGHFSAWQSGTFGGFNFFFSTNNEAGTVNGNNTIILPTGTHSHYNLGFTEPGVWEVELTVSGTHVDDGFKSDTGTFNFNVVPEPGSALLLMAGGAGLALIRRRRRA